MTRKKPPAAADRNQAAATKAARDLERLEEQSEKVFGAGYRFDDRTEDWAQVWGQRIGRGLGLLFAVFLVFYLLSHVRPG